MDSGGANAGSSDSAKPSSTEPATLPGCGCASATNITVRVTPTTGGQFDLQVAKTESVENLKKLISKKLKVPKERICLLHRDRQLREGTLQENQLMDGSRLTLLPSVETGLLAQRPEQSVMQALESLNDSQVNDFLSGKAPLNLTMRLGDHMMLIQLQLSTVTPSSSRRSTSSTTGTTTTTTSTSTASPSLLTASRSSLASSLSSVIAGAAAASKHCTLSKSAPPATAAATPAPSPKTTTTTTTTTTAYPSTPPTPPNTPNVCAPSSPSQVKVTSSSSSGFKFSPPTSPPAKPFTSFFSKPAVPLDSSNTATNLAPSSSTSTPVTTVTSTSESAQTSSPSSTSSSPSRSVMVCKLPFKALEDVKGLLGKKLVETVKKHSSSCTAAATTTTTAMPTSSTTPVATSATTSTSSTSSSSTSSTTTSSSSSTSSSPSSSAASSPGGGAAAPCKCDPPSKPTLDTRALAEASRNLTQTLKQLSSEVLTSRTDPAEDSARARRQGAIIESMHHHGKGVYSGTFSGTLNPALQDRFGRPKRDISTIIHILNDLLCATPQYRRHARQGHTITVEATSGTPKPGSAASDKGPSSLDLLEESVSLSRENQATRGKMEHLRLIMEERRARRRARREARAAPYTTQWSAKSESLPQSPAMGRDQGEPMETGEQPSGSDQQLCEPAVA